MGSTDAAEMEATRDGRQGRAASVPEGEAAVAVAADEEFEAGGAGVQQSAGGVYHRRHGDAEWCSFFPATDYHAVSKHLEAVSWLHPNLGQTAKCFTGASYL